MTIETCVGTWFETRQILWYDFLTLKGQGHGQKVNFKVKGQKIFFVQLDPLIPKNQTAGLYDEYFSRYGHFSGQFMTI